MRVRGLIRIKKAILYGVELALRTYFFMTESSFSCLLQGLPWHKERAVYIPQPFSNYLLIVIKNL